MGQFPLNPGKLVSSSPMVDLEVYKFLPIQLPSLIFHLIKNSVLNSAFKKTEAIVDSKLLKVEAEPAEAMKFLVV